MTQQLCQQYHDDTMTRLITTTPGNLDDVSEVVEHWTYRPGIGDSYGLELQSVEYLIAFGRPTQRLTVDYYYITVTTTWGSDRCETSETVSDDWVEMLRMIEDSSPLRAARQLFRSSPPEREGPS